MAFYAHSSVEVQGVGELISIVDLSYDVDNQAEQETTMKEAGAGFSFGQIKVTGSFNVKNSTTPEKDWIGAVRRKEILGMTFKNPDGTRLPVTFAPKTASFKDQEVGASMSSVSFVGFTPRVQ